MTSNKLTTRHSLAKPSTACMLVAGLNLIWLNSAIAAPVQVAPMYSAPEQIQQPTVVPQATVDPVATTQSEQQPTQDIEQPSDKLAYNIQVEKSLTVNPIQSQGSTGTCWSFATASFIEAEMIKANKGTHHFSEMFLVKNIYRTKAQNYLLRQGKAQFSQGALAHDFLNAIEEYGLVPEEAFDGLAEGEKRHDHGEMEGVLAGMLNSLVERSTLSDKWEPALDGVLNAYLGNSPERFEYKGRTYSPKELANELGYNREDYVSLTSYTHHPFGKPFVLEIPDNFSNGLFLNLPIDDLIQTIDNAIANGHTVAWDGDVSESGFSSSKGLAILPDDPRREDRFEHIGPEKTVTQVDRQQAFLSHKTTDDHLMHLVGISRDAAGNKYYIIKNSWGDIGPFEGYMHMSEAYVRAKTIALIVNKNVVVNSTGTNTSR